MKSARVSLFNGILLVFFLSLSVLLQAQTDINPDSALPAIINNLEGNPLSLEQAVSYASEKSARLKQAEAVYLAALGSLRRERGYYDPEFFFSFNYEDLETPSASFFAGADVLATKTTTSQTGLRLNLPVGTQLELALNTSNLKTNSTFAFLNPEYNTFGSLRFFQPLLGGFNVSARKELSRAELAADAAKARYEQEMLRVNAEVESIYWDLFSAQYDFAVQQLTRDRAEAFLEQARLREKAGLIGPNQVANARTFFAEQELLLIDRLEQLDARSDRLASLIGERPAAGSRYKTTDTPPDNFSVEPVDAFVEQALTNSLDLQAAQKEVDAAVVYEDAASWEALPKVNLVGSLVSSGLGGTPQEVTFGDETFTTISGGSFGNAISQVFKRDYPGWSLGVDISIPIGLRSGLGEQDRLEAESFYAEQRYVELSRSLEEQVRSAHRELIHGNSRLKAAAEGVDAAEEQVRISNIEFENGRLTAFELVRLNEDFAVAQRRYSEALVRTVKAAAELKQLTSGWYSPGKI
ncbi:MAG: TolC family protein [Ignavibacteriaceae bacterium]